MWWFVWGFVWWFVSWFVWWFVVVVCVWFVVCLVCLVCLVCGLWFVWFVVCLVCGLFGLWGTNSCGTMNERYRYFDDSGHHNLTEEQEGSHGLIGNGTSLFTGSKHYTPLVDIAYDTDLSF